MKTTNKYNTKVIHYHPRRAAQYPNAATARDVFNRVVDYILTAVTSAGIVTILACLFTFF